MNGVVGPNLLHVALLALAAGCALSMLREVSGKSVTLPRLAAPAGLAAVCALLSFGLLIGSANPSWAFGTAMVIGLGAGAVRGSTIKLRVDHIYGLARTSPAADAFAAAVVLPAMVLLEIGCAFVGAGASSVRGVVLDTVAVCAGVLIGRASAIAMRWHRQPHRGLRSTVQVE